MTTEHEQPTGRSGAAVVNNQQAEQIREAVKTIANTLGERSRRNEYGGVYGELYRRFGVTSYKLIPAGKFSEVMSWLRQWQQALTAEFLEPPTEHKRPVKHEQPAGRYIAGTKVTKTVDPTKSLAQTIYEQTGASVPALMFSRPAYTTAREIYELVEIARRIPGLLASSAEMRALTMLADTGDLTADGTPLDAPIQIDSYALRNIAAQLQMLDKPNTALNLSQADVERALFSIAKRLEAIEQKTTVAPHTLGKTAGGDSAENAPAREGPNIPKRKADLARWRATWAHVGPLLENGHSAGELLAKAQAAGLCRSATTLRAVIAAGEAGLLNAAKGES